ncbi:hypothetical protein Goshw_005159 [Gossypium schwendimanii]|uniref:Uncharacterized protein n=1 Tax=Gossypium schwendimanii TaxID=34291 RepID=A0A7J9KJM8_GOSSC|nr:hypothetical protein [Gossypium schwendimanii]
MALHLSWVFVFGILVHTYIYSYSLLLCQHFIKSTRRKHQKGSNHYPMWYHCSVRCFGFTMHFLRRMLCY